MRCALAFVLLGCTTNVTNVYEGPADAVVGDAVSLADSSIDSAGDTAMMSGDTSSALDGGFEVATDSTADVVVADGTPSTDACTIPTGGMCDPFRQCGCPPTEHCTGSGGDRFAHCQDPRGSLKLGDYCATAACGVGLTCILDRCTSYCASASDCVGTGPFTCAPYPADVTYSICTANCDPKSPGPVCGAGGCAFLTATRTGCRSAGSVAAGGACAADSTCAPGTVCKGGDGTGPKCRKYCTGLADCAPMEACTPLGSSFMGTAYGYCFPK